MPKLKKLHIDGVVHQNTTPHYLIDIITQYNEFEIAINEFDINGDRYNIEAEVQSILDHIEAGTELCDLLAANDALDEDELHVWWHIYANEHYQPSDIVKTFRIYYIDAAGTELNVRLETE